ncbi:MAG: mitochondrial fission ELM1 family protein [Candidatus Eutrophobiaceae bacterium]
MPQLEIWSFLDNRPGHISQSKGLCAALQKRLSGAVNIREIHCLPGAVSWLHLALGIFPLKCASSNEQSSTHPPDLLIGAGHSTHLPLLAARRACGGKTIVLMHPSLPLWLFDLCVIPAHDRPKKRNNVIITEGVLNACPPPLPSEKRTPLQGIIVLGGPSRHYGWLDQDILTMLGRILEKEPQISWELCDSRRTPATTIAHLKSLEEKGNCRYIPHEKTAPGWLAQRMGEVGTIWVSEDSVSMICEALGSGAAVGLLPVPALGQNRIQRQVEDWQTRNHLGRFHDWEANGELPRLVQPLREAERVAELLLERNMLCNASGRIPN